MKEDRDRYVIAVSCPCLFVFAVKSFAAFSPLMLFYVGCLFTLPFD